VSEKIELTTVRVTSCLRQGLKNSAFSGEFMCTITAPSYELVS